MLREAMPGDGWRCQLVGEGGRPYAEDTERRGGHGVMAGVQWACVADERVCGMAFWWVCCEILGVLCMR